MSKDNVTLRAQACRFRRAATSIKDKFPSDWEPGIAFLKSFDVSDVEFIIDAKGKKITHGGLYDYSLLNLRVDGYLLIEPHDYAGKKYSPKADHDGTHPSFCD